MFETSPTATVPRSSRKRWAFAVAERTSSSAKRPRLATTLSTQGTNPAPPARKPAARAAGSSAGLIAWTWLSTAPGVAIRP